MPTSRLWKPFTIPQKFLDATSTSSAPIFRLPTEVLILIFNQAKPLDQFSLALVCKRLLQVSSLVSFKTDWMVGDKVREHNETMEALLRTVKPKNKAGRRERKAWLVCIDCLQYRPTRKSYWNRKKKKNVGAEAEGDGFDYWDGCVRRWNDRGLLQCPECRYDEQVLLPRRLRSAQTILK